MAINRIKKIMLPCIIIGLAFSLLPIYYIYTSNITAWYKLEVWLAAYDIPTIIFTVVTSVYISYIIHKEVSDNAATYIMMRSSKKKYVTTTWIFSVISGFLINFTASFISLIYCLYIYNFKKTTLELPEYINNRCFAMSTLINQPFMYGFLISFWRGLLGIGVASIAVIGAFYLKNLVLKMVFPWFIIIFATFIFQVASPLGVILTNIYSSYDLCNANDTINTATFVIPVVTIITINIIFILIEKAIYKNSYTTI